jgi:hypothetical protein
MMKKKDSHTYTKHYTIHNGNTFFYSAQVTLKRNFSLSIYFCLILASYCTLLCTFMFLSLKRRAFNAFAINYLFPNFVVDSFKLEELSAWIQDVSYFPFNSLVMPHKFMIFLEITHSFTLFFTVRTLIYILNLNKNIFFQKRVFFFLTIVFFNLLHARFNTQMTLV